ncbi:phospholipase A-2-activating protein-like [Teleopsis dalmanni]|uniref:phospholipase A-2-activating protein-like n=1 Tax=Teleopsis dalmanni TaxID=139649 RepID=UPI0018CD0AC5|nr:phospholipase A-2-activating protein-like [Teleopsis dalmanni]
MSTVSLDDYKLSCELFGHGTDVRAVAVGETSCNGEIIISGSRDKTTKLWKCENNEFNEMITFEHHVSFVSCVYYAKQEDWICSGSNDGTVCIYKTDSNVPILILKGHQSNVCAISSGLESRSLITGSWDGTARVWKINREGVATFLKLIGHTAAVWAVDAMPTVSQYVTGSADKKIFIWNDKGEKIRTLSGHTDCIRGLEVLPSNFLVSAGNDSVIRLWDESGKCVGKLNGHTDYIYSIAQNTGVGTNIIVSSGEDSCLRMWDLTEGIELGLPILHPGGSVWSVACFNNGDIVTGCSDGVVRVFTKEPKRFASEAKLEAYDSAINARKLQMNETIGTLNISELPGPEALLVSGKKDGESLLVSYSDGSVKCYNWQADVWKLVGDVIGASGGSESTFGKILYEGKEYDYVFSINISDSLPEIKLPYNREENPWIAAQVFLNLHNLPQTYLDRVANFVIKNSSGNVPSIGESSFQSSLSGSTRYLPDSLLGSINSSVASLSDTNIEKHFPINKYIVFHKCDADKVKKKLEEFNSTMPNEYKVSQTVLELANLMAECPTAADENIVMALNLLLEWPNDKIFPVLDIIRLVVQEEEAFTIFENHHLMDKMLPLLKTNDANQLMILRSLANMLRHNNGQVHIRQRLHNLLPLLKDIRDGSSNLQIALAVFYLNLSITQTNDLTTTESSKFITEGLSDFFEWSTDLEACYHGIQALGNLTTTSIREKIIADEFLTERIRGFANLSQTDGNAKISSAAKALLDTF